MGDKYGRIAFIDRAGWAMPARPKEMTPLEKVTRATNDPGDIAADLGKQEAVLLCEAILEDE